MKKRLLIALSLLAIAIIGFVIFFYAATATKKQEPVNVTTPVSTPTNDH
jgi:hypothetical protein